MFLLLAATSVLSGQEVLVKDNLLTVQAYNIPLQQILQQIADQIKVEITVQGTADNMVSANFTDTDIADAFLRIAPDFNSIVLYTDRKQKSKATISKIQLYAIAAQAGKDSVITFSPKSTRK